MMYIYTYIHTYMYVYVLYTIKEDALIGEIGFINEINFFDLALTQNKYYQFCRKEVEVSI